MIVGGDPERRGVVSSASYEAREFGVHAGMPLSRARRLCPQATFIQANFSRYRDASARFMEILAAFSPSIEPLGIDEAYLDVTGYEQPYGSPRKLALTIKQQIHQELKVTASIGIATCKVIAKIASGSCKPDGLLEIAPGKEQDFLNPLPVARLPGVGEKTEQALKQLGISTIGEFASLPPEVVKEHLGKFGIAVHSHARGIDDRRVEAPGETKSISQEVTFARDTLDRHFLEANLRRICQKVGSELRSRHKQAGCVTLKLRYADFSTITRQTPLKAAANSDVAIFATASQLLNKVLAQDARLVRLIGVRVSNLVGREKQLDMFDSKAKRVENLNRAIEEIRKKYGQAAITTGSKQEGPGAYQ